MYRIQKLTDKQKQWLSLKLLNLIEGRDWVIAGENEKFYGCWTEKQAQKAIKK